MGLAAAAPQRQHWRCGHAHAREPQRLNEVAVTGEVEHVAQARDVNW